MKKVLLFDIKRSFAVFVATMMMLAPNVPNVAFADHDPFNGVNQTKVDICHWAGNSYNDTPQVNINAILNGHGSHTFDIIPPFHYDGGVHGGLNWTDQNAALWNGNCTDGGSENEVPEVSNCSADTNLVTNGSFETPDVPGGWNIYAGDGVAVPGWTSEWESGSGDSFASSIEIHAGVNGWDAQDGSQYVELDGDTEGPSGQSNGEPASTKISQTISTVPGASYNVSFWTSARPGVEDNEVEFSWDGSVVDNIEQDGTSLSDTSWLGWSGTLVATGTSTVISFADKSSADSLGSFIDNIVVSPICGFINGIKYHDVDGDGERDEDEDVLDDWTIYLDINNNNELDEGEPSRDTNEDGWFEFEGLFAGDYTVRELMQDGWIQTAPGGETQEHAVSVTGGDEDGVYVEFGNQQGVTIRAHKIVCEDETHLPDWADAGNNIDADTAADFVADHSPHCWFEEGWKFQWAPASAGDPGDTMVGEAGEPWVTFGPTDGSGLATAFLTADQVEGNAHLWFREVLEEGYIPFTHDQNANTNTNGVSAEMYCHVDGLNYDNYDRIDGVQVGSSYDCVAWNVAEPETEICDFDEDEEGWYGRYYNYVATHPDMNLDPSLWPDKTHGDPQSDISSWDTDWYDAQYFVESKVDSHLNFGAFFPPDDMGDDTGNHNYHFGVHWTAMVNAPVAGNYNYSLTSDDDVWVYVNDVLVSVGAADASGIHAPTSFPGTAFLNEGSNQVDIYFAERHVVDSWMSFAFQNQDLEITPWNDDCVGKGEPTLAVEKSGLFDSEANTITYIINWQVNGEGSLYDASLTDTIPAGTTYVDSSASNGGTLVGADLVWDLGDLAVGDNGSESFTVTVDSGEVWADSVVFFDQALRKNGSAVLVSRSDPSKALGAAQNNDTENFVSLGFGGELILGFENYIVDGVGNDIRLYETSYGNPSDGAYPETVHVYVSQDNVSWVSLGTEIQDGEVDLADGPLSWAKYVKLVDVSNLGAPQFPMDADGYDVDAVRALNSAPEECMIANTVTFKGYISNEEQHTEGELRQATAATETGINKLACQPGGGDGGDDQTCEVFISGQVFHDVNESTFFDGDPESGLDVWTVYVDLNNNNALDEGEPFDETSAGGQFSILVDGPGTYTVRQITQDGWSLIFPTAGDEGEYLVTVDCDQEEVAVELDVIGDLLIQAIALEGDDVDNLRFANVQTDDSSDNNGGGGGGSRSGSGSDDDDEGDTAGDQIEDDGGEVLGETLPVTGTSIAVLGLLLAVGFMIWSRREQKPTGKKN